MNFIRIIMLYGLVAGFFSCGSKRSVGSDLTGEFLTQWMPSAPAVIYKTKGDYVDLVPVIMNQERTRILSYPDPVDLKMEGKLMKPHRLKNGYLLDNRGISEYVAFLDMTYEEYSQLDEPPHIVDMMLRLRDRYPLVELIQCGLRSDYADLVYELNVLIDRGLTNCRKIEIVPMSVTID
jgi:hypothetical protein